MKTIIYVLLLVFVTTVMKAQNNLNRSVGDIVSHEWDGKQLKVYASNSKLLIEFYTESIVRVRIVQDEFVKDFSYAVDLEPQVVQSKLTENRGFLELESSELRVFIQRNPVRLAFYDKEGRLLNEDDQSFGTSWIGEQVTTYKSLKPGEKFFGCHVNILY